jgi:hypothetical protein
MAMVQWRGSGHWAPLCLRHLAEYSAPLLMEEEADPWWCEMKMPLPWVLVPAWLLVLPGCAVIERVIGVWCIEKWKVLSAASTVLGVPLVCT